MFFRTIKNLFLLHEKIQQMNNIKDLHIEKEILPLFDFTLTMLSKNVVLEILKTPLKSKKDILSRQNIFKGIIENKKVLKDYSYTISYLLDVHHFLNDSRIEDYSHRKLRYKFLISKKEKASYKSRFTQLILLFHRLEFNYFSRLNLEVFPEFYREKIRNILAFLSSLNLNCLSELHREYKLKNSHFFKLATKILEAKSKKEILDFWDNLFLFEAYLSISNGIEKHSFSFPELTEKTINLAEFYHPLISNPVTNNFQSSSNVILLNGPNMSGKSTFLKAVSLCAYLGHLGIGIPAKKGEIPLFTDFSIAINRQDDILNGYSHFMTEIVNLKKVVEKASNNNNCFAVFDELFSGTNVEDAFEICKTTINGLCKFNKSLFFISTHIQELKQVKNNAVDTYYIECDLIDDIPTFTYKLKSGWSKIKVGRILFEKEGLNDMLN